MHAKTEHDATVATIPSGFFKFLTDRREAVLIAKRFCRLGASMAEIEDMADAVERRRNRMKGGASCEGKDAAAGS